MLLSYILNLRLIIVNILFFLISTFSFSNTLPFQKYFFKNCYTIVFWQENYFEGETDTYKGILVRKENEIRIYYFTKPLFYIKADDKYIELGYENGDKEIYDRKDYKNPILEVLLNLNKLDRYFSVEKVEGNLCILKPKGDLKDYIETVKVYIDKKGLPKEIEVLNGADNYSRIFIKSIENSCVFKIRKP